MTENKPDPEVIEYSPTKKRSWLVVVLIVLLIITWSVLGGGGYYIYKNGFKFSPAGQADKDVVIAELKQELKAQQEEIYKQIGNVQNSINSAPKNIQPAPVQKVDEEGLKRSLSELSEKLQSIEKKVENPEARIDNTLTPLVLSAINLRQRISEGSPYALELQIIKDMSRKDKVLADKVDEIAAILEKNEIRRIQDLQAEFPSIADSAAVNFAKEVKSDEETTLDKIKNALGKWVVIRKIDGDLRSNDAEVVLARMQRSVLAGNLRRALEDYKKLDTEKAIVPVLDAWAKDAKNLVDVEEKLSELNSYIVRRSGTLPSPFTNIPDVTDENAPLDNGTRDDPEEDSAPEDKPTDAI